MLYLVPKIGLIYHLSIDARATGTVPHRDALTERNTIEVERGRLNFVHSGHWHRHRITSLTSAALRIHLTSWGCNGSEGVNETKT